jgi:hypothetical protein
MDIVPGAIAEVVPRDRRVVLDNIVSGHGTHG